MLLLRRVYRRLQSGALVRLWARRGVVFGDDVRFVGAPIIRLCQNSTVRLGDRVHLISDSRLSTLGVDHPLVIQTRSNHAVITIGDDVGITGGTICAAQSIDIGPGSLLGANVTIVDTDFHPLKSKIRRYASSPPPVEKDAISIGRNVFIGTRSVILKGVSIGDDSVIGAGSVVTSDIPASSIAAGSPARVLRTIDFDSAPGEVQS